MESAAGRLLYISTLVAVVFSVANPVIPFRPASSRRINPLRLGDVQRLSLLQSPALVLGLSPQAAISTGRIGLKCGAGQFVNRSVDPRLTYRYNILIYLEINSQND